MVLVYTLLLLDHEAEIVVEQGVHELYVLYGACMRVALVAHVMSHQQCCCCT